MLNIRTCFFILFSMMLGVSAHASHIYGADFFYEHVTGYTYRVSLVVYGDCPDRLAVPTSAYPNLPASRPQVVLLNNGIVTGNLELIFNGPAVEVTPVCAAMQNSTTCKSPDSVVPGVTRYTYSALLALPSPYTSSKWVFRFTGEMNTDPVNPWFAGRSNSISNINIGSGGSVMVMDAALNNVAGQNSSPRFTTIPTPFYCINIAQSYNQGAVDPNSDSLAYALAPGREGTAFVSYKSGYSATTPLRTSTGSFSFSPTTGQMNFTPDLVQRSLVVNEVTEYRNGVMVGTASREMTFVVLPNCNNTPASSILDTSSTANIKGSFLPNVSNVNICEGTDSAHFDIIPTNPGANTINASINGLPVGATAKILLNNTSSPVISIDWNAPLLPAGSYNFFVTYKDDGCPLSSQKTQAYTVRVIRPAEMITSVVAPTNCVHQAYVHYNFAYGLLPRNVSITRNGAAVKSFTDNTGTVFDSLGAGIYKVTITSPQLPCASIYTLQVVDSGLYPNRPLVTTPIFYCLNDMPTQLRAQADSGATLKWYSAGGMTLSGSPTPRTDTAGIFTWYVNQLFKVCESLKDTVDVYVTKRPIASIDAPPSICLNDTISISFNGSIGVGPILEYFWDWDGAGYTAGNGPGPWMVHWFSAGEKTIRLSVAENKCSSPEVEKTITIKPTPYAGFYADFDVCQFDTLRATYNTNPFGAQRYAWNFDGADIPLASGPGPYILRWDTAGLKRVSLTVDLDGCSDTRAQDIRVMPAPDVRITNAPGPVCIGDKIFLKATGGDKYVWLPQDSLLFSADGSMYAQILKPSVYRVKAISDYGCIDSAAITYGEVEPCCNFAYPNAFSPNGDGRNDRFRVVTYGNHLRYELSIYNNWGQRVYYGLDPDEGWDGRFKGKPCDAGTYFYYLNATCFTGRQESHKGDLMLLK